MSHFREPIENPIEFNEKLALAWKRRAERMTSARQSELAFYIENCLACSYISMRAYRTALKCLYDWFDTIRDELHFQ